MSTQIAPSPVVITIDPAIKNNEQAFKFWKEKLPPSLLRKSTDIKITFKYLCPKKGISLLKLLLPWKSKEQKQFTTVDSVGLAFFQKGDIVNNLPLQSSNLAISMSGRDEHTFLKQNPVDVDGFIILGKYFMSEKKSFNGVEISCLDIVSITYTEIVE